jgi:uroporphyrinogen decarboxylase
MNMIPRERVIAAIEFKGPDRVPHRFAWLPAVFEKYRDLPEILKGYKSDFVLDMDSIGQGVSNAYKKGQWTDEFGCVWTVAVDGYLGQVTKHPLARLEALKDYRWPDPNRVDLTACLKQAANKNGKYLPVGWLTTFERMVDLRGFDNIMIDIAAAAPELITLRDRIVEYNLGMIKRYLELDCDAVELADDWGTQIAMQVQPEVWKAIFLPAYQKMFEAVRSAGKHVFFHSDGVIREIIPDLIRAGVNVFWIDLTLNSLDYLHEHCGGKVCFQGLTDVQFVLREGTAEQAAQHGRDLIAALGDFNGGFIACSELAPDQPLENIISILDTFDKAVYPLNVHWDKEKCCAVRHGNSETTPKK